jgi:hypothetical protein
MNLTMLWSADFVWLKSRWSMSGSDCVEVSLVPRRSWRTEPSINVPSDGTADEKR